MGTGWCAVPLPISNDLEGRADNPLDCIGVIVPGVELSIGGEERDTLWRVKNGVNPNFIFPVGIEVFELLRPEVASGGG